MKIIKLSVVLLAVASLSACSDSPSEVVEDSYEALCDDGLEAMAGYALPSQQENMVARIDQNPNSAARFEKKLQKKCSDMPEAESEEITGDSNDRATVHMSDDSSVRLKKIDGEWKVNM